MTVSYVGAGNNVTSSTSVTPSLPVAALPGNVLIAVVESGHPTSSTQPSTPAGWRLAGTVVGTSGTYGVDAGPRRVSIYLRLMQFGDAAPTFSIDAGSESRIGAHITAWSFAAGESVQWSIGLGQDTTSGTGFSVTTTTALSLASGDTVYAAYIANTDAVTWSGHAFSASGITFGTVTERSDAQSVVGADVSRSTASAQVTSGTATAAVTLTATMSGAATGVAGVISLRDTAVDGTAATASATYDDTLARVQILASGMSGQADVARVERSTDAVNWTTVRGASAVTLSGGAILVPVDDYEFTDAAATIYRVTGYDSASGIPTDIATVEITPSLFGVWLKSTARPFLNTEVEVVFKNPTGISRPARAGVFDVIGRTYPIAVSDVRKSQRWTMYVRTETYADAEAVDLILASGDVLYVHTPDGCPSDIIPGGYVTVGDSTVEWHPLRPESRLWTLPCTEVAAPGPDVGGAAITWASVLAQYGSWNELLTAVGSWADLLASVGSGAEVLVP